METNREDRMIELLRRALPPVEAAAEPARDLWPLVLDRLDARPAATSWVDRVLLAALFALAAVFPSAIPVFLYYL